jgi:hypothetical protein
MTLEAVPPQGIARHYHVTGLVDDECTLLAFANYNESEYAGWNLICPGRETTYLNTPTKVVGRDLVWTFRLSSLGKRVSPGMIITDFRASTGVQEIWFGQPLANLDTAESAARYRIG